MNVLKFKSFLFGVIMLAGFHAGAQKVTQKFITRFAPLAKELSKEWGIPVSILLGVSVLESGSGTSINARQLNNYFGVKGKNIMKHRQSKYKQFDSPKDSFESFCRMISRKKFYKKLKGNMDYHAWLAAMNTASYAGSKGIWVSRIKTIIQDHKISQYDK